MTKQAKKITNIFKKLLDICSNIEDLECVTLYCDSCEKTVEFKIDEVLDKLHTVFFLAIQEDKRKKG